MKLKRFFSHLLLMLFSLSVLGTVFVGSRYVELPITVHLMGMITPFEDDSVIKSEVDGVVVSSYMQEGGFFNQRQKLLLLDDAINVSEKMRIMNQFFVLLVEKIRIESHLSNTLLIDRFEGLKNHEFYSSYVASMIELGIANYRSERRSFEDKINALQDQQNHLMVKIADQEAVFKELTVRYETFQKLELISQMAQENGVQSKEQSLKSTLENNEVVLDLINTKTTISELNDSYARLGDEIEMLKLDFYNTNISSLRKILAEEVDLQSRLEDIDHKISRYTILAPFSGYLWDITPLAAGTVVSKGEVLGKMASENSDIYVKIQLPSSKYPEILLGQSVEVSLLGYGLDEFDPLIGKVSYVGHNAKTAQDGTVFYDMHVLLDQKVYRSVKSEYILKPGNQVQAIVLVGEKSLFNYLFDPIMGRLDHAMSEGSRLAYSLVDGSESFTNQFFVYLNALRA